MIRRLTAVAVTAVAVLGCTTPANESDEASTPADVELVAPPSASAYRFELVDAGDIDRRALITPLPVGRRASITVSLGSLDGAVDVLLDAVVDQAGADGQSQLVQLVVVGVDADGADGLRDIIGSTSRVIRDGRLAVVEQDFDLPDGLSFRADAVVRQALRAPFALVGPLPLEPVGVGASWVIETAGDGPDGDDADADADAGAAAERREVAFVSSSADGYELAFDVAAGAVVIRGRAGELLPTEQIITLENATVRVVAERVEPASS